MSISPVRTEVSRVGDANSLPVAVRSHKVSDMPENVFAPPGVFTRLTALLQTFHPNESVRPEVVAKGRELAANPAYPAGAALASVAAELLGGAKA